MNIKELTSAIQQLAVDIRYQLNQADGSVYANDPIATGIVKFSIVREGKVKIFTITINEESL